MEESTLFYTGDSLIDVAREAAEHFEILRRAADAAGLREMEADYRHKREKLWDAIKGEER